VVVTGQLILQRLQFELAGKITPHGQLVGTGGHVVLVLLNRLL
jgi:hypothetical protein